MRLSPYLSIALFWLAYGYKFQQSLRDIRHAQYTRWVYLETLCLMPAMCVCPVAREIALVNTCGLAFGSTSWYVVTKYELLREFGDNLTGDGRAPLAFPVLLLGDFVYHWLPWLLLQYAFSSEYTCTPTTPNTSRLWIGAMTAFGHSTYIFWLNAVRRHSIAFDASRWCPKEAYGVRLDTRPRQIFAGWFLVLCGHLAASTMVLTRTT